MASSDRGSSCNVSQPKMQEPLLESRADIQSQAYRGLNVPWASLDSYYARSVDNPSDSRSSEKAGMSARIHMKISCHTSVFHPSCMWPAASWPCPMKVVPADITFIFRA